MEIWNIPALKKGEYFYRNDYIQFFGAHLSQPCLKKCRKCLQLGGLILSLISFIQLSPFLAIAIKDENNKGSKPSLNIPSSALRDPYVVHSSLRIWAQFSLVTVFFWGNERKYFTHTARSIEIVPRGRPSL